MVVTSASVDKRAIFVPSLSTWGQAVLLLLIAIGVYFQTWIDIWPYWENKNATYTHGTLVALVAVWLAWRTRSTVNQFAPAPSVPAVALVILLSAAWLLAERANVFIIYATLWPILAFAILWAGLGKQTAFRFAFPLSFLYFAIPLWDYLKPPLQAITSMMAGLITTVLGIPAAFDGPYATLPTATIFIAEDCSGAHFLCVALAVGVLAGVLRRDDVRTRLLILVIAALLSMVFNWLRIVLIVLAYLHPDLKHALETMGHLTFGWWVFALDLVVFSVVLRYVPRTPIEHSDKPLPDPIVANRRTNISGLVIATIAAAVLPTTAWTLPRFDSYPSLAANSIAHSSKANVELVAPDLRWSPYFPGAAWEDRYAIMSVSGNAIEIYRNQYFEQTQGRELISRAYGLFDPLYFSAESSETVVVSVSEEEAIAARRDILTDRAGNSWLAIYTYFVDGEPNSDRHEVQLFTAFRSLYSRPIAGVVAAAAPCLEDCALRQSDVETTFLRTFTANREIFNE